MLRSRTSALFGFAGVALAFSSTGCGGSRALGGQAGSESGEVSGDASAGSTGSEVGGEATGGEASSSSSGTVFDLPSPSCPLMQETRVYFELAGIDPFVDYEVRAECLIAQAEPGPGGEWLVFLDPCFTDTGVDMYYELFVDTWPSALPEPLFSGPVVQFHYLQRSSWGPTDRGFTLRSIEPEFGLIWGGWLDYGSRFYFEELELGPIALDLWDTGCVEDNPDGCGPRERLQHAVGVPGAGGVEPFDHSSEVFYPEGTPFGYRATMGQSWQLLEDLCDDYPPSITEGFISAVF